MHEIDALKKDTSNKRGIKGKKKNAAWDYSYLLSLLAFFRVCLGTLSGVR